MFAVEGEAAPVELFMGQVVALLPVDAGDAAAASPWRPFLGSRSGTRADGTPVASGRPRTYSLITNGQGGGVLTVGGVEIAVQILPLDLTTPQEATVFRVAAVAGRAVRLVGTVDEASRP